MDKQSGSCLCGKIKIEVEFVNNNVGVCHCGMCRKWSAGPYLAVDCGQNVKIENDEHLGIFNSSEWAERGFCKNCGTALFYRFKQNSQYIVSSELFNEVDFKLDHQIFIDKKPSYYEFANETENMTEKEVLEKFGG
jgi:hypothetical protein